MKMTIEQTVAAVKNAPGSMYTREDVISLLSRIETTTTKGITMDRQTTKDLCEAILEAVKDNARNLDAGDVCDLGTAEFSLNYNEVQLDSVDIDTDSIAENVVNGIYDVIEEFFENLEEESVEEEVTEDSE